MNIEALAEVSQPNLRLSRISVGILFALAGAIFANWVSRIPEIQRKLALSDGQLGLVLVGGSIGVLIAMVSAGGLIDRFSSRRVTIASAVVFFSLIPPLAYTGSPYVLFFILVLIGATMGCMDVSMNAQAVYVEHAYGRKLMSSFHAIFSVGAGIGAAISSLIIKFGIVIHTHFILAALVGIGLALFSAVYLLEDERDDAHEKTPTFSLPGKALLPLGIIAFISTIGEGSMGDWTAVYLKGTVGTTASVAAIGFAAFSTTMTIGRLLGDRILQRFKDANVIRFCGATSALGFLLAALVPSVVTAILGFALVGVGLSVVIPMAFSRAGNMPGIPSGRGIASVATLGYSGFLIGPPFIGFISDVTSLRVSFVFVAIMMASLILLSNNLRPKTKIA